MGGSKGIAGVTARATQRDVWQRLLARFGTPALGRDQALWALPAEGTVLLGFGVARELEGSPDDVGARWQGLSGAVALGGFAFDAGAGARHADSIWNGFPAARLVVPRLLVRVAGGETWVTCYEPSRADLADLGPTLAPGALDRLLERAARHPSIDGLRGAVNGHAPPTERPADARTETGAGDDDGDGDDAAEAAAWMGRVTGLVEAIRAGSLRKVVLARRARMEAAAPFAVAAVLRHLWDAYPGCAVFAFCRNGRCFVGATPEWLVRLRQGTIRSMCLAGSAPRGATAVEDRRLAGALQADPKERLEHNLVVNALRAGLAPVCDALTVPDEPDVLRLPTVQHLYTPVSAQVRPGVTVLDLVRRLHPTPAVGGHPKPAALDWLRRHEGIDRGWYAGAVGWVGPDGDGEFAVAIRSALIDGTTAWLFAGCGIMADSQPAREWQESELKLQPMRRALHHAALHAMSGRVTS